MIPEIKDLKTWEEAEIWLARHGYGLGQIELIKAEWNAPEAAPVKAEPAAEAIKPAPVKKAEPIKTAEK